MSEEATASIYNAWLVAVSLVVAVLVSYALAMGIGIWSE
jgi:hypothetical protein